MSATAADVRALEHLAARIREDTRGCAAWDKHGLHVIFQRELVGMHLLTAIEIAVGNAQDPEAKTPAAISRPFVPKPIVKRGGPSKRDDECPEHPGQPRVPFCGGHRTDELLAKRADDAVEPVQLPADVPPADAVRIAAGFTPKHQEGTKA